MNQKNQKGITLIALVVTIIVLLILAGVTINMVLGNDGIIAQAQQAKLAQREAQLKEEIELYKTEIGIIQRKQKDLSTEELIDLEKNFFKGLLDKKLVDNGDPHNIASVLNPGKYLYKKNITFEISISDSVKDSYNFVAQPEMTWEEWINSAYNTIPYISFTDADSDVANPTAPAIFATEKAGYEDYGKFISITGFGGKSYYLMGDNTYVVFSDVIEGIYDATQSEQITDEYLPLPTFTLIDGNNTYTFEFDPNGMYSGTWFDWILFSGECTEIEKFNICHDVYQQMTFNDKLIEPDTTGPVANTVYRTKEVPKYTFTLDGVELEYDEYTDTWYSWITTYYDKAGFSSTYDQIMNSSILAVTMESTGRQYYIKDAEGNYAKPDTSMEGTWTLVERNFIDSYFMLNGTKYEYNSLECWSWEVFCQQSYATGFTVDIWGDMCVKFNGEYLYLNGNNVMWYDIPSNGAEYTLGE